MNGWNGERHDITLGHQNEWMHWLSLGADVNRVDTAVGNIGGIDIYDGRGIVIVRGGVGNIDFGGQDDRLIVDEGHVFSAKMWGGDDTVIVRDGGRIESLNAFGGVDTIDVKEGSRVDHIRGGDGTLTITASGNARLETVSVFNAELNLTTDERYVTAIQGFDVETDITIGTGGAGTIKFTSETEQSHKITGSDNGYIALIETADSMSNLQDDQSAIIDVSYFVGAIRTGNGVDKVSTGDGVNGYVESIWTSGGNDTVTLGTGGAGQVNTSRGDDTIRVKELFYNQEEEGVVVRGGAGVDDLNFARFTKGVTFSLDGTGTAQEAAKGSGFFSEFGIENLIGTSKNDKLTGDKGANVLSGRGGGGHFDRRRSARHVERR